MSGRRKDVRQAQREALASRDCTPGELDDAEHRAENGFNVTSRVVLGMVREIRRRRTIEQQGQRLALDRLSPPLLVEDEP